MGLLVGAGTNQKLYYLEADALGTPRVVIDPVRNVAIWRWRKLPRQADIPKVEIPAWWLRYSMGVIPPRESWGRCSL